MPDPTPPFVPGYIGTITLDTEGQATLHVTRLNQSRTSLPKRVIGASHKYSVGGQFEFTFGADGSVTPGALAVLQTAFRTQGAVEFSMQIGAAGQSLDAGVYAGWVVLTALNITGNADGQWEVSVEGDGTGEAGYTAPGESL